MSRHGFERGRVTNLNKNPIPFLRKFYNLEIRSALNSQITHFIAYSVKQPSNTLKTHY